MWFVFPFYVLVTSGYLVVTCGYLVVTSGYLVVTSGYLIATAGYFWLFLVTSRYFLLLLVPRFSNNVIIILYVVNIQLSRNIKDT